jgi:uncharacterized protein YukE
MTALTAQLDPWAAYRGGAATQLNTMRQSDPSDFYRDKLLQMGGGTPRTPSGGAPKSKSLRGMASHGGGTGGAASGGGQSDFLTNDPSYQWRFQQGQQAVERSLASKGLLQSGNAAIELQQYGQGAASQEYGAQFTRMLQGMEGVSSQYDTQMQRLMEMAGVKNAGRPQEVTASLRNADANMLGAQTSHSSSFFQNNTQNNWKPSLVGSTR